MLTKTALRPTAKTAPPKLAAKKPAAKKMAGKKPAAQKAPARKPPPKMESEQRFYAAKASKKMTAGWAGLMSADPPGRMKLVYAGLPIMIIDQAALDLDVSKATLFSALSLPVSTMTRRAKSGSPLSLEESDRMDRVAQVFKEAIDVFGDKETGSEWMSTRLPALGDRTPLELLDSSAGYQMVLDTLGQISYGAPA